MNKTGKLSYIFRKSPVLRAITVLLLIALAFGVIFLINYKTKPTPFIEAINPPVGSAGDVVTITGRNFGNVRDTSYVEFSGSKLTGTSYISWTDTQIRLVIPANIQNGLVVVGTVKHRSKPAFFANAADIPTEVKSKPTPTVPVIVNTSVEKIGIGNLLTIKGMNFGSQRDQSKVLFTIDYDKKIESSSFSNIIMLTENMISPTEDEFSYEYWSNSEIRLHVPDGASTGVIIVETANGKSDPKKITIDPKYGKKSFTNKKIFLMNYSVDLADIVSKESSTITLRCPLPVECASQKEIEITEILPQPVLENYQKTMIHQLTAERATQSKYYFKQTFVIPVYEINTKVIPDYLPASYSSMSPALYKISISPDELVPSGDEKITELAAKIIGKEANPYKKAKLVYQYMLKEFKVQEKNRKNDVEPLALLKSKKGDVYDFAVIYTALLRASGVPCMTDSGILVSPDMTSKTHFWAEFYICGLGWIPVDVALGAGLEYKTWSDNIDSASYYFGNLDSHHIKISRGWNQLKPFSLNSKIVQRPRSFALQSIWEESSNETVKYSSFWSNPVIRGIY